MPVVAVALRNASGKLLVQQRPAGKPLAGLWEFPGGKIESGEAPEVALARELREELDIAVLPQALLPAGFASEPLGERHLLLLLFLCSSWQGEPRALDGQTLAWVDANQLEDLPMPDADRVLLPVLHGLL
ncbi:MAG: (deoxy)nucleoside triphosphate pyrophosphohydrolase [Sphingomonas sp.]